MDWTPIILAVLAIISAVVTGFLIPLLQKWLKGKMSEDQLSKLDYWLRIFIAAAESAYGDGEGRKKKAWVLERIKALGLNFDVSTISDAIDGLCRELTAQAVINDK